MKIDPEALTARQLVIKMAQVHPRPDPIAWTGINLAIREWLGIAVRFEIDFRRVYHITCQSKGDAQKLRSWFGGDIHESPSGRWIVWGHAVDLTM